MDWSIAQFCTTCNRKMRRSKEPPDGVTVKHASGTTCAVCYKKYREKNLPIPDGRRDATETPELQTCVRCRRDLPWEQFGKEGGRYNRTCRICNRSSYYSIDRSIYDLEMKRIEYRCAICRRQFEDKVFFRPEIDHCHDSDVFRSLLCGPCNRGLGLVRDNLTTITAAIEYLSKEYIDVPLDYRYRAGRRSDTEKVCTACGTCRSLDMFRSWTGGGKDSVCILCTDLLRRFKLSVNQYNILCEYQEGCCAICSKSGEKLAVDHDHACCKGVITCGECIRGLLCTQCNLMLGTINDDHQILRAMFQYLLRHRPIKTTKETYDKL